MGSPQAAGTARPAAVAFAVLLLATFGAFLVASRLKAQPAEVEVLDRVKVFSPNRDGRVDVERIRRNVASGGEALARALCLEALDAFVSYALFSARNVLPHEVAERLARTYLSLQEGLS